MPYWFLYGFFVTGFIGGKVLLFIEKPAYYIHHFQELLSQGFVFYGSLIFVLIYILIYAKIKKIPLMLFLDIIVLGTLINHSIGRFGCFLGGCCFGKQSDTFSMYFPNLNKNVIPTQLFECIFLAITFFILLKRHYKKNNSGKITIFYFLSYSTFRFFIEFLRDDFRGDKFLFLSISQIISLIIIISLLLINPLKYKHYEKQNF